MKTAIATVLCLAVLAAGKANAAIVPVDFGLSSSRTHVWTYNLQWHQSSGVFSGLSSAIGLAAHANFALASSFTLHGFAGYVSGTCTAPAGWVCTAQEVGSTAADVWSLEAPASVNLVWAYTSGPAITGKGSIVDLGQFSAQSIHGNSATVNYSGQTFRSLGSGAVSTNFNGGATEGPAAQRLLVPEPASLGLAGLGLLMLALHRRRRPG